MLPADVFAWQEIPDRWYTGSTGMMFLPGGGSSLKRAGGVSANLGYFLTDSFALEADIASVPNAVSSRVGNSSLTMFGIQGAWHFMGFERFDPFLTFGASSLFSTHHVFSDDSRKCAFGPTFGIGFLFHLSDNLALRADSKAMVLMDSPSEMAFTIAGGLQWSFGGGGVESQENEPAENEYSLLLTLKSDDDAEIAKAIKAIREKKEYSLLLRGHIDCKLGMGRERAQRMSSEAARKIKAALTAKGIDEDKIEIEGAGFSNPIKPFNFASGVPENNRVEIFIKGFDR
jgi:hypothetical protein